MTDRAGGGAGEGSSQEDTHHVPRPFLERLLEDHSESRLEKNQYTLGDCFEQGQSKLQKRSRTARLSHQRLAQGTQRHPPSQPGESLAGTLRDSINVFRGIFHSQEQFSSHF